MPFPGIPPHLTKEVDSCVNSISGVNPRTKKNYTKSEKIAICISQIKKTHKLSEESTMAEWTREFINDLPDGSFAIILPGGKKDSKGKTVPRSLRKLPYKDQNGNINLPHLRNALARLPQTDLTSAQRAKAKRILDSAAKRAGVGEKKMSDTTETENVSKFSDDERSTLSEIIRKIEEAETLEAVKVHIVELKSLLEYSEKEAEAEKEEKTDTDDTKEEKTPEETKKEETETTKKDTEETTETSEENTKKEETTEESSEEAPEEKKEEGTPSEETSKEDAVEEKTPEEGETPANLSEAISLIDKVTAQLSEQNKQVDILEKVNTKFKEDIESKEKEISTYEEEIKTLKAEVAQYKESITAENQAKFNKKLDKAHAIYCDLIGIPEQERAAVKKQMSTFSEDMLENTIKYATQKAEDEPNIETQNSSQIEQKKETKDWSTMNAKDKTNALFDRLVGLSKNQ